MDINTFAQTLFYLVSSVAILVVGGFLAVILYHLVRTVKNLEVFSNKLNTASDEIKEKVQMILEKLANLPIISLIAEKLLKKNTHKKGRTNNK